MNSLLAPRILAVLLLLFFGLTAPSLGQEPRKIVLVAGETAKVDKVGHHDYLAGGKCLEVLLQQTPGVTVVQVADGWPQDQRVFDDAKAVVFYTDGGGKQAFLKTPERIRKMQAMAKEGVGFTMIHQAVDFPKQHFEEAQAWLGGVYLTDSNAPRGHWDSQHTEFPTHPITRGVAPWKINDGWLGGIQFVEGKQRVTPLLWSGKEYAGSRAGLDPDIVAWAYTRKEQGRAFGFTGLDAHSAWSHPGMRRMVVNGILWTAGLQIPNDGAPCDITEEQLASFLTPRTPKKASLPRRNKIAVMETAFNKRGDASSIEDAKRAGYTAIQLHSGVPIGFNKRPIDPSLSLPIGEDATIIEAWRAESKKHNVEIISLCAGSLNKCQIWDRDREIAMRIAKQTIDACESLDVKIMLFPFFGPSNFQTNDEAFHGVTDFLRGLLPYAKSKDVVIGIEAPVTTVRVLELLKRLEFPEHLKIYYDTGNLFSKEDIYETIRMHAKPHFCEVHIKASEHAVVGQGNIDLKKLAEALDAGKYDKWLVYEANRNGREPKLNRQGIEKLVSLRK